MIRRSGVHGGLQLEAHNERSTARPLRRANPPAQLVLPVDQHAGAPARPIVREGERVLHGQPIAEPTGQVSAWLHAPASGRIIAIEPRPAPHRLGAPTLSIVIENDQRDDRAEPSPSIAFEQRSPAELLEQIARGGVVGLGGAAFPLAAKLDSVRAARPLTLLLNGAECEPYITCDEMLMRERAEEIVLGARILLHASAASACAIALEAGSTLADAALRTAIANAHDERLRLVTVPNIYPAGGERQLIAAVFGLEVPYDGLPADIGLLCHNVGTAAAVAQWIRDGQPLTSRIVTVTGDCVREPGNLDVRLGASIRQLIEQCGGYTDRASRLIMGGSLMGLALPDDDLPVIKATNCIIAASHADLQPRDRELPCIRCGACSEACPAMLLPQQLHWFSRLADLQALEAHGLMDCIECGCCDYVCPSQIPLVERFRETKPLLARRRAERADARAARERFEARAARLERIAVEQRAALAHKRRVRRED
ncbi:MAG TPA: electron transport complex subunit RsxC [Steroidobacter sp.]|jgi:electron transport complex protein RnfC|nr:electron transport complex subunit RsxC [Steroidobacter sp.]